MINYYTIWKCKKKDWAFFWSWEFGRKKNYLEDSAVDLGDEFRRLLQLLACGARPHWCCGIRPWCSRSIHARKAHKYQWVGASGFPDAPGCWQSWKRTAAPARHTDSQRDSRTRSDVGYQSHDPLPLSFSLSLYSFTPSQFRVIARYAYYIFSVTSPSRSPLGFKGTEYFFEIRSNFWLSRKCTIIDSGGFPSFYITFYSLHPVNSEFRYFTFSPGTTNVIKEKV